MPTNPDDRKDDTMIYGNLDENNRLTNIQPNCKFDKFQRGSSSWSDVQSSNDKFRKEQLGEICINIWIEFPENCLGNIGKSRYKMLINEIINLSKIKPLVAELSNEQANAIRQKLEVEGLFEALIKHHHEMENTLNEKLSGQLTGTEVTDIVQETTPDAKLSNQVQTLTAGALAAHSIHHYKLL